MSTYDAGSISAALTLDRSDFSKGLDQAKADADKFAGKDYTAKVKADTTAADKPLAATQAKADKLGQSSPTVKVNVDNAQATARIAQIQAQIQRLSNIIARPQVSPDTQKAYTQLDALNAELDELGKKQPTAKVEADTADAQAKIDDLNAKLDRLETRDTEIRVKASADLLKAQADLAVLQAQLDSVGASAAGTEVSTGLLGGGLSSLMSPMAALIGVGVALSPILITVGTGLAGFAGAAYTAAKPIEAAATATGGLQANMASLTGPQQQVAQGLLTLEGQFGSFSKALSPQVFSAFNSGLSIASTLLTDAAPVAAATGTALDGILTDVSKGLQDAEWKQFFTFMAQTAGPDVQLLGQAFGAAANALPPLLEALQPIATTTIELTTDFANLVGAVANWGKSNSQAAQVAGTNLGVLGTFTTAVKALVDTQSKGSVAAGAMAALFGDQATATGKAATAAAQAQPSLTSLGDDITVLGSDTATAANQTTALTDAWNILVGNFASKETAILNAQSAVQQFGKAVQQQGSGSLAAKQAFEAAATSIGQMVDAEQKSHAPASQMYTDLQNQIKALQASGPLNAEETQQLNGMKQAADAVANSTAGWSTQTKNASAAIQTSLLPQLAALHANTPVVRTDINNLANSIVNTGTKSASTEGDRAQLIKDLENAGVSAKTAQTFVNNLGTAVKNLPAGKALKITMQGDGSYNIVSTVDGKTYNISQGGENSPHATGGLITQGTHGTADDVPARLSRGEWVIKESSSSQYGYGAMDAVNRGTATIGYAAGGQVGTPASGNLTPSYVSGMYSTFQSDMTDAMVSAMQSTIKAATAAAAAAAAATSGGGGGLLSPSGSGGSVQALMKSMAASVGWTGAEWTALNNVEMREAGYSLTATNPSSGAYGLAQFINGASEYAQYGGNSTTAAGQITGMFNYIKQRYGDPIAAWAHEQAYNWYGGGTGGAKPGWAVTGEKGRELVYMHGGETVLPHAATERVMAMHSAGTPGYASGTPNVASLISGTPSGGWQAHVTHLQHVLKVIADSLGIKGLGKTDIANLKSEQGRDNASLKTSLADLKILTTARDKITKTTEPGLNKQISALNALAGIGKLSSAESSLLKTLKASLAGQQAQLSKINVAINGKPAPAAKAATTAPASSSSSTDSSGTSTAASATTPSGAFTGVLPSAPGLGAPNITGGGTGGLGGIDNATLGTGGFSSGVNASGYQITPSAGSGFQDWGGSSGGFDTSGIEALLQRILAVNQSAPAVTGSSFGASLNGLSRQVAIRSAYSTGAQL